MYRQPPKTRQQETRAFRKTDWDTFRKRLENELNTYRPLGYIDKAEDLDQQLERLKQCIRTAVEETVPVSKPTPYTKRWWNPSLSLLVKNKKRLQRAAHAQKNTPNHPIHQAARKARKDFKTEMNKAIPCIASVSLLCVSCG